MKIIIFKLRLSNSRLNILMLRALDWERFAYEGRYKVISKRIWIPLRI